MNIDDILLLLSIMENEATCKQAREFINHRNDETLDELTSLITLSKPAERLAKLKDFMQEMNFEYVSVLNDNYPTLLREIYDYPLGLFVKGNVEILNTQHLAIVGTRKPTYDGKKMCDMIMKNLAGSDTTIVSGLAFGIDIIAHNSAMKYGLPTISVLPSSVTSPVPKTNIKVAKEILQNGGLLVSEKPPGYNVQHYSYVQRNRIISGMSSRTVIVEASLKSGTMTTARFALEQDREIYAVPGSISNPVAEGPNKLIYKGATPLYNAAILREDEIIDSKTNDKEYDTSNIIIKFLLENGKTDIDTLSEELEIQFNTLQVMLMELELSEIIGRNGAEIELL